MLQIIYIYFYKGHTKYLKCHISAFKRSQKWHRAWESEWGHNSLHRFTRWHVEARAAHKESLCGHSDVNVSLAPRGAGRGQQQQRRHTPAASEQHGRPSAQQRVSSRNSAEEDGRWCTALRLPRDRLDGLRRSRLLELRYTAESRSRGRALTHVEQSFTCVF